MWNVQKVVMRLKPERVQQLLARLPGWKLREDGLASERSFPSAQAARSFVSRVCKLAEDGRQPVLVRLAGSQVTVILQGPPTRGCIGGIDTNVFNLAGQIG